MASFIILFLATCFLAYSNGANDNFKGVATLFGSGTSNYRAAIWWATAATFFGSICSIFLAETLVESFSGKGLVPDVITISPDFLLSIAMGAGLTVMLASITGFPISTTHSLTGALVGGGSMAVGAQVNFALLRNSFFMPLLLSPLIAVILGAASYAIFRCIRNYLGITKEWCICIGETEKVIPIPQPDSSLTAGSMITVDATLDTEENCKEYYTGNILGISCQKALDFAHFLSAGMVSFARGLNDTPKIVALLLAVKGLEIELSMVAIAIGMAAGGLFNAQKVAETMSKKITLLNHGQGFAANIATGALVIIASRLGMPVSTTHVSVGSLIGVGFITKRANFGVISEILLSWILTLPIAALFSGCIYWALSA